MKLQEKQKELEQEIIANLRAIPKMPEDLLPHTVYVEEEGEDDEHHGIPVYTAYKLEEIRPDGSCAVAYRYTDFGETVMYATEDVENEICYTGFMMKAQGCTILMRGTMTRRMGGLPARIRTGENMKNIRPGTCIRIVQIIRLGI